MASAAAWFCAFALFCAGLALVLVQRGTRARRQAGAARVIERFAPSGAVRSTGPVQFPAAGTLRASAQAQTETSRRTNARPAFRVPALDNLAARAGLEAARLPLSLAAAVVAGLAAAAAIDAGLLAGTAAGAAGICLICLFVTARAQRRRLAIVQQLPGFLDGIVRLVTLGNSVPAAFQAAMQTSEGPLRECLERVARSMRAGMEIDRALSHIGAVYRVREFEFVGAVLRLSVKYGGRADVMLERMAAFMRDVEQAERELAALSAETRLSAWVLAAMPIVIGGLIVTAKPTYFSAMWADPEGRRLVDLAFGLQIAGAYLLYRLARLRA
ncbi:type II secretion system F family protein [Trinickia caryophylli]|uniref:Tight adherence protein B n=1 Tax=Trinickia caryophylli TaxID=28094 RepID=A0A1X7G9L0_TRICW|nr:type II secretion system F family protein [Trinickia caryophylli]PMS11380.1 pilus assembly protein [Trinickia caryophylli]TRX17575.1 pilus assembly protein [Trinickia caryophylli]WQE11673.1 type II secretion system F family protein [Trinickia caryophylli]SMF66322.1 tight adherence protein B [Trinickia caryophylli]GLU34859.1 fimbriae-related outer membrane protein [Trinickia caryophylli]